MRWFALVLPLVAVACVDGVTATPLPIYDGSQPPLPDVFPTDVPTDHEHDAAPDVEHDAPADVEHDVEHDAATDASPDAKD
jgi:hypothetical protein